MGASALGGNDWHASQMMGKSNGSDSSRTGPLKFARRRPRYSPDVGMVISTASTWTATSHGSSSFQRVTGSAEPRRRTGHRIGHVPTFSPYRPRVSAYSATASIDFSCSTPKDTSSGDGVPRRSYYPVDG